MRITGFALLLMLLVARAQLFPSASLVPALSFYAEASLAFLLFYFSSAPLFFLRLVSPRLTSVYGRRGFPVLHFFAVRLHVGYHHVPGALSLLDSIQREVYTKHAIAQETLEVLPLAPGGIFVVS